MVEGSKSLIDPPSSFGICGFPAITEGGPEAVDLFGTVSYSATIMSPTGNGTDSGTASVSLFDSDNPDLLNSHNFGETFTSTAPPGGGGDDDDDDGNDNGNGDG